MKSDVRKDRRRADTARDDQGDQEGGWETENGKGIREWHPFLLKIKD